MEALRTVIAIIVWFRSITGEQWLWLWVWATLGYCLFVLIIRPAYQWLHQRTFF